MEEWVEREAQAHSTLASRASTTVATRLLVPQ